MSYSTRRSGQPQQQTVGGIGQRRPVVTNNFVSGGQLTPQSKPGAQMSNQQQRPPMQSAQQNAPGANFRGQQAQNQGYQQTQQTQQGQPKVETQPIKNTLQGTNPSNPAVVDNDEPMDQEGADGEEKKGRKPFWNRRKIPKKEKMRRRNLRLSKILQPKNAVMILNELVKTTSYVVEDIPNKADGQFKATVAVDGVDHVGYGRTKIQAKNSAAEFALRQFVKSNKLNDMKKDEDEEGNEKMDVSEDGTEPPLPWQHFASFALFKLLSSWGEDPNSVKVPKNPASLNASDGSSPDKPHENKPAKKLPDNPETLNPLMVINQMMPTAQFEEIGKSGNPPNVTFSYRCNVDEQSFVGTGPSKKAAKKLAAYGACHKVLGINYPTDVYVPIY